MTTNIQEVSNSNISKELELVAEEMVDEPWYINVDWATKHRWVVVPAQKGRHFEEEDADRVAHTLNNLGYKHCFAVATEPVGETPHCYYVPATKAAMLEFSDVCAGLNFALVPENLSWIILFTSEDYNLYAGDREFVEFCLPSNITDARQAFREFASDDWWEGRLLAVANKYEEL